MAFQEPGIGMSGYEVRVSEGADEKVAVGGDPMDVGSGKGGSQPCTSLAPGRRVDDDLGQHGVVVRTHDVAGPHA